MGVVKLKTHAKKKKSVNKALVFGVMLFLASIGGYAFAAITKPLPNLSAEITYVPSIEKQDTALRWPSGQGVIGTIQDGILASSGPEQTVKPIASMTKLVTALAVLEKQPMTPGGPGKDYTVTSADLMIYREYVAKFGSVMPVSQGQVITQYQALQALLLPSANNIADMLAIAEFGSIEAYSTYANEMLASNGLTHTTIADASGFSPNTVSTPNDMFEIGRKALANPVIAEIVAQRQAVIPGTGLIRNTNQLLSDENVIGLKTGTTDEAGSCLLFAFIYDLNDGSTETVIGAVMGSPNWPQLYREVRSLIADTKQSFGSRNIVSSGRVVGSYNAPWGMKTDIITAEDLTVYGWLGKEEHAEVKVDNSSVPVKTGSPVGFIEADGKQVMLTAAEDIKEPGILWRLANYW